MHLTSYNHHISIHNPDRNQELAMLEYFPCPFGSVFNIWWNCIHLRWNDPTAHLETSAQGKEFAAWKSPIPSGKHTKNITKLWKSTIFHGKIHYKWPFSIVMLNYQRVQFAHEISFQDSQSLSESLITRVWTFGHDLLYRFFALRVKNNGPQKRRQVYTIRCRRRLHHSGPFPQQDWRTGSE